MGTRKSDTYRTPEQLKRFAKMVEDMRVYDLSAKEIARRLGVPVSTMNVRMRRYEASKTTETK